MKILFILLLFISSFNSFADEGMWQPHQLLSLKKELKSMGLKLDPSKMSQLTEFPMGAVINFNGCTASFVSPNGLLITNHHCAYGSLQYNSTETNNVLEDGLLATALHEELPATPGSRVYIALESVNVSDQIVGNLPENLNGYQRYQNIEKNKSKLIAECESDKTYRCDIIDYHGGLEYFLFKQLAIRDVRLVHAPTKSIGLYGGDIDNWMWPRHTGDYAFFRAYVGKDGKPVDFSKDNIPYQPKHFLKMSRRDLSEGDFVMVMGYPGSTNRYRTASEIKNNFTWVYPTAKGFREELIDIIKSNSKPGSQARIKYESEISGLANYAKNYGSLISSYQKSDFQSEAEQFQNDLLQWIRSNPKRRQTYSKVVDELDEILSQQNKYQERDYVLAYMQRSKMISTAKKLYRLAKEREKPDLERDPEYQERNLEQFKQSLERLTRRFDAVVDKAAFEHFLLRYSKLGQDQRISSMDQFFRFDHDQTNTATLKKQLDLMYVQTELDDEATRLAWVDKPANAFQNSKDPFIQLAVATYTSDVQMLQYDKNIMGLLQKARAQYMQVLIAYNKSIGKPIYADANSSLRITYGTVKPYSPKDGLRTTVFTTLEGIAEKDTGQEPFNSPQKQLELIKQKQYGQYIKRDLGTVPVNFLSNLDITGGNSGSPTLNSRGEMVGLVFDGVYESIISDWHYHERFNRAIHVDVRYILWVMQYIYQANSLLQEIGVKPE